MNIFCGTGLLTQAGWNVGLDTSEVSVTFVHLTKAARLQGRPTSALLHRL